MEGKLCPYCMQTTFGDFCKNCKKNVDYQGKPMQLPVGTELQGYHHYIVGAALGQGGFGVTYLALDTDADRRVALKEFFPVYCSGRLQGVTVMAYDGQDVFFEKGKQGFLLEAQTMQRLARVKSVVGIYDCFQANNTVYLVMEYVEGQSLKAYLEENGPIAPEKLFPMVKPLLEDVALMHRQGVIHRDIAPDNIILDTNGRLRLIDFGTAREYIGQASMTVVVKKGFAPVEQYTRKGQSAATDVYALAATMYFCLTGHLVPDSMERIGEDPMKRPSEWGVKLPQNQEDALIRALRVLPNDRTQTVDAFLAELMPKKEEPKSAPAPKAEPKQEPKQEFKPKLESKLRSIVKDCFRKKKMSIWIGIAAAVLTVIGVAGIALGKSAAPAVARLVATEMESAESTAPNRNVKEFVYAYSDDPTDRATYTAEEFAQVVNAENVQELLPLGTKIKMVPNSKEITDESIEFELVAYKHFRLANGSDMAKTTWLAVNLLNEKRQMNTERMNKGGWAGSDMRRWLNEKLYPSLPSYWKGMMQSVQVRSLAGNDSDEIVFSNDYLFLPSLGEVDSAWLTSYGYTEEIDPAAEELTFSCFTNNDSRMKAKRGAVVRWWLRSPWNVSSNYFATVPHTGISYTNTAFYGVCPGFCLGGGGGTVPVQNAVSYAYSDDPKDNAQYTAEEFAEIVKSENVRDLLPLGTRIKMAPNSGEITDNFIEFELVAYNHFRLADGEDFAKTTWLAVNLLNEKRQMNKRWTNQGGWPESEMRQWMNETLYPTLPQYWKGLMQSVQVRSTAGQGLEEIVSSNDHLFLPSWAEVEYSWREEFQSEVDTAVEELEFACFSNKDSRLKKIGDNTATWWLRSPYGVSKYSFVGSNGGCYDNDPQNRYGVCLGFCM